MAITEGEAEGLGGKLDFLEHFSAPLDPRQGKKVLYPLDEVLLLTLCAVLSGADGWVSVAVFIDTEGPAVCQWHAEP